MKTKFLHIIAYYALALSILLTACSKASVTNNNEINHVVLCWLKHPHNNELVSTLIKESYKLQKIPGIINFKVGRSIKSQRSIVDDSFDFAIYMIFKSKEDMEAYIKHPIHQRFVKEKLQPNITKVLVYDF